METKIQINPIVNEGTEFIENIERDGKQCINYSYSHNNGHAFGCVEETLEKCRAKKDKQFFD